MNGPILVVEDDGTLTRAVTRNLVARGYDAVTASSVEEAIAALKQAVPSMVLLDIDLPDGSGWEVLRELRREHGPLVPVIVMSALRPNPRLAQELHCFSVLEKPFPMESLMRLIEKCTDQPDRAAPSEISS